jgi:SNF family Na+-dependent transporter
MFDFDLSAINGRVVLMAVGHAFFSIGVAMGLMMGFGAYLGKEISIAKSALIISAMDTAVALIAGIAIFPIVFANGLDPLRQHDRWSDLRHTVFHSAVLRGPDIGNRQPGARGGLG